MRPTKVIDVAYYRVKDGQKGDLHHVTQEVWEDSGYHCPNCAAKSVWVKRNSPDYYLGDQFICTSCGRTFYLPHGAHTITIDQDKQRLAALRGKL